MPDAMNIIWPLLDCPSLVVSHEEVQRWPADAAGALKRSGILRDAGVAECVACPSCIDRHVGEVVCRRGADGEVRYFIPCPESLRVEVSAEDLRRWVIDVDAIARSLAVDVNPVGQCKVRVPSRLWRLGALPLHGVRREVYLARGIGWPDAGDVLDHAGSHGRAIVLIPGAPPSHVPWRDLPATLVPLSQLSRFVDGGLVLDLPDILALVQDVDAANRAVRPVALSQRQQKRAFRDAAAVVLKSAVRDDDYVDAYLQHGSYRKAAEALSERFGFPVSKDRVKRAVDHRGGVAAVADCRDSNSVRRTVANCRSVAPVRQ